jgi:hypothetical protein
MKRKHPSKGEIKKQGARTKVQGSNSPNEAGHQEEREPLRTEPSSVTHSVKE